MKAEELRLGNWVYNKNYGRNAKITQLWEGVDFLELDPIALTPEILEAAGFEYNKEAWNPYYWKGDITLHIVDKGFELFASEFTIGKTFFYLHDLQNISSALFGEELTVNLNQLQQA